jgi:hypothetical protein
LDERSFTRSIGSKVVIDVPCGRFTAAGDGKDEKCD